MDEFDQWLLARGVDCIGMASELRKALRIQYEAEQRSQEPPETLLLIPDDCDQWGRAIRLEVASCG